MAAGTCLAVRLTPLLICAALDAWPRCHQSAEEFRFFRPSIFLALVPRTGPDRIRQMMEAIVLLMIFVTC